MDFLRKIELGVGLVTILTAFVGIPLFFGGIRSDIQNLKEDVKDLKPEKIREEKDKALKDFEKETEKIMEEAKGKIASLGSIENVRVIVTKSDADEICSSVSGALAAHVPPSYLGKTGQEICAANNREQKRCSQVPFVWVSNNNMHGKYTPNNKSCNEPVKYAWPWGDPYSNPNTLSREWGHGNTWVVCCYK
ncbi:MAG: hypothetical protein F6K23_19670 [Okeania sp. SIO2C9]|uniref:hypothetical protein n=1 Tax=Okeania sp. SIO2C9 TaxID=2607791 RepID=UPI0013BEC684|nr:hypothetical protein [Okeania sp. SIO2C9]NEQ75063.1 hypothetical protein [Okeania sp. SIO2C9]